MPTTFSIVTTGYPTTESSATQTLERLTVLLKNEQQARMLLSGTRRAIKSRLTESAAMKYFQAFNSAGLAVKIEPEPDTPAAGPNRKAAVPPALGPDPTQMPARGKISAKQRRANRSEKKKQPQQKTLIDSGLGLLSNLVGLVVGGVVFGLVSALLTSLTGAETFALIAATPLGLGAWRMTAEAIH